MSISPHSYLHMCKDGVQFHRNTSEFAQVKTIGMFLNVISSLKKMYNVKKTIQTIFV
jgi:hypothetical protein